MNLMRCKYEGLVNGGQCRECWEKCNNEKPKWFQALAPKSLRQCRKLNKAVPPDEY